MIDGNNLSQRNINFIDTRCNICGGVDCAEYALSKLSLICGYGSENDGETIELTICGTCADAILYNIKMIGR